MLKSVADFGSVALKRIKANRKCVYIGLLVDIS